MVLREIWIVGQTQVLEEGNFGHFFSQFAYSLKYLQLNTVWRALEKAQAGTKLATGRMKLCKNNKSIKRANPICSVNFQIHKRRLEEERELKDMTGQKERKERKKER